MGKFVPRRVGRCAASQSIRQAVFESLEHRQLLSVTSPHVMKPIFMPIQRVNSAAPLATAAATGTTPAFMRKGYGLDLLTGDGTGQTIAIVDAYNEPTIVTDLAAFCTNFAFPQATSFTVVNQTGGSTLPAADTPGGWGGEIAMDVEWAHVMAPKAGILLVEANSANDPDLYAAVDYARNYPGVSAVSMSWGGDETSSDSANDFHFTTPAGHQGVTFFSSSGDAGRYSDSSASTVIVGYPAASPNVVAVGGTTLNLSATGAWSSETGWGNGTSSYSKGGSGGGISKYAAQPSWQSGIVTQSTNKRTLPDISMDADPNTGVPVYSKYDNGTSTPWEQYGGTSLSSPMMAGLMAVANQMRVAAGKTTLDGATQTLPAIYTLPTTDLHDITSGNNGYAANVGYDLVTGRGSPIGNLLVPDLAAYAAKPAITNIAVNPTTAVVGDTITLTATGVTDPVGTVSSVNFYADTNGTAGLQIGADTPLGVGSQSGTTWTLANASTTGLTTGAVTLYAVANDSANSTSSNPTSTTITLLASATPVVGGMTITPSTVIVNSGTAISLAATGVSEIGSGTVANVTFYRDSNGTAGLQISSDTLVGTGTQSGSTWTLSSVSTTGLAIGTYTFFAVAADTVHSTSATASAVLTVSSASTTGALLTWETTGQSSYGTQGLTGTVVTGLTNSTGLTRGSGLTTGGSAAADAWGANGWSTTTAAAGTSASKFITFGMTIGSAYTASLSAIDLNYRRSTSGPANALWEYQLNSGTWSTIGTFTNQFSSTSSSSGAAITEMSLTSIPGLQNLAAGTMVNFRLTAYGATATGGNLYIYGPVTGNDLIVKGTIDAVSTSSPLVLTGPANYLELDADGTHLDIWNAADNTGTYQQMLLSGISSISYAGTSASDSLTVDFTRGNPLPATGMTFDGGSGGTNTLRIVGTSNADTISVGASSLSFGTVPINFNNTTAILVTTAAGADTVSQTAQPSAAVTFEDPTLADTLDVQAGTFTFAGTTSGSSANPLSLNVLHTSAGATVVIDSAASHASRTVLVLNTLNDSGTLNLKDNDLILHNGDYSAVKSLITSGLNLPGGYWDGTGIRSSVAAGDTGHYTTLAMLMNDDGHGNPLFGGGGGLGNFDGQTTITSDLLIKFTYYGDANLSGNIDGSDYSLIDNGFNMGSSGWINGDFNFDSSIDGTDYSMIDNNFTHTLTALTVTPKSQIKEQASFNQSFAFTSQPTFSETKIIDRLVEKIDLLN